MMNATPEQAVAETAVFWDIKTCPVPPYCDANVVGRCINRYFEKLGYSGRLTIIAVGLLTDFADHFLRAVSSAGIVLNHAPLGSIGILRTMYAWKETYPPPANMILISSSSSILSKIRHACGYNIFQLFPNKSLWEDLLLQDSGEEYKCSGTAESASWLCSLCSDHVCQGFENFTTHLSCQEHKLRATQILEEAVAETLVLWDINACPVPPDCDARQVRPCIKQYLEDLGYSGPLTINAIGLLTHVPRDVLRAVSSTGIVLKHIAYNSPDITYQWIRLNPPPANVMVICSYTNAFPNLVGYLQERGYNIIELFPYNSSYSESLWKNFLEDSGTPEEEDKCSETGEHASWVCSVSHSICGKGFENLITHLSQEHEHEHEQTVIKHPVQTRQTSHTLTSVESDNLLPDLYVYEEPVDVLWDIKSCPVPPDCDAHMVCSGIKQYLVDLGYSGPVTIKAIGLLTDFPLEVLQAVASTGIVLHHIDYNIVHVIYDWILLNPPQPNIMVICPYSESFAEAVGDLHELGFNIIELFPFKSPYSASLWKKFLLEDSGTLVEEDKCSETGETGEHASWVCSVSHNISGKGFKNFITHLSSQEHERKPTEMVAAVTVFWDIKGFPVPPGCDARQVSLCIKKFLKDFGYSGRFIINAIGLLTEVPLEVLEAVSSTGIDLKHAPFDPAEIMYQWISFNPPPAKMLVICPYSETLAKVVAQLKLLGYTVILLFPCYSPRTESLWENFLLEVRGTCAEEDKGSEAGEHPSWGCSVSHDISGKGFPNLITHLFRHHKQEMRWEKVSLFNLRHMLFEKGKVGGLKPELRLPF